MDLAQQLVEASRLGRQYRDNNKRIDVHPQSYEDFVSLFNTADQPSPVGSLLGIPVYKKDYVPLNRAFLTTKDGVVVFNL